LRVLYYISVIALIKLNCPHRAASERVIDHARALYDYDATQGDELALRVGDVVQILEYIDESWFRGKILDRHGIFPSSFVEIIGMTETAFSLLKYQDVIIFVLKYIKNFQFT
jgi:hypothetical protein